jgi:hypothetical protein
MVVPTISIPIYDTSISGLQSQTAPKNPNRVSCFHLQYTIKGHWVCCLQLNPVTKTLEK